MMNFDITSYGAFKEAWQKISEELVRTDVPEEVMFEGKLALCELVANVLRHGGERAHVVIRRGEEQLLLCVRGENGYRPPERFECPAAESERGRGMFLVDALCDGRDFTEEEGVRVVFRLPPRK